MDRQPYRIPRSQLSSVVVLLSTILAPAAAPAGLLPSDETLEAMITTQQADASFLGRRYGPDAGSPLEFVSGIDLAQKTFSYSLVPGSTYRGLPITLTASGTFDSAAGQWSTTSVATLGADAHTATGTLTFTDPPGDATVDARYNEDDIDSTFHGTIIGRTEDGLLISSGMAQPSFFGVDFGPPYRTIDLIDTTTHLIIWRTEPSFDFSVDATGAQPEGGIGSFRVTISAVPEPSTMTLAALGLLLLRGCTGVGKGWYRGQSVRPAGRPR